jgi:hypothetical protein
VLTRRITVPGSGWLHGLLLFGTLGLKLATVVTTQMLAHIPHMQPYTKVVITVQRLWLVTYVIFFHRCCTGGSNSGGSLTWGVGWLRQVTKAQEAHVGAGEPVGNCCRNHVGVQSPGTTANVGIATVGIFLGG